MYNTNGLLVLKFTFILFISPYDFLKIPTEGFTLSKQSLSLFSLAPGHADESGTNVTAAYIGNKNTKKIHKSSCSSVGKMNESNKVGFNSRSAAISAGYDPCKNCSP